MTVSRNFHFSALANIAKKSEVEHPNELYNRVEIIRDSVHGDTMQRAKIIPILFAIALVNHVAHASADESKVKASERQHLLTHLGKVMSVNYLRAAKDKMDDRVGLVELDSKCFRNAFGRLKFFGLRFQQYPRAYSPPKTLCLNNVFVVVDRKIVHITREEDLEVLFATRFVSDPNEELMATATECWLRLAQALNEDGYLRFKTPVVAVDGSSAGGVLEVVRKQKDHGSLKIRIVFGENGFESAESEGEFIPGSRPR